MEKDNNKFNVKVINMNKKYYLPNYEEKTNNKGWVTWGEDNLFPNRLLSLMNRSSKHNAILKTKATMIGGNGFNKNGMSEKALNFLKNSNSKFGKFDLDEILARVSYDLEIYGSFCLNIIWSVDRKSISSINYIDTSKVRINYNHDKTESDGYWISNNWANRKEIPTLYPGYSEIDRSKASQILYVKEYRPGCEWYGIPEYISAANWIELEYEISMFHLASIRNGFHPSMVINFATGTPTDEEMDSVITRLKEEYEGAQEGSKVLFTFSDNKETAPSITPIQLNDSDERFIELNNNVTEGIFVGHRATNPNLFGVRVKGELGNKNDLIESLQVFQSQYIDSKQYLLEKVFNKLSNINKIEEKLEINKFKLEMNIQPNVEDLLSILNSPIDNKQKYNILILIGYTEEEALSLLKVDNIEEVNKK